MSIQPDPAVLAALDEARELPASQQPSWPDPERLRQVLDDLTTEPPLVFAGEADVLTERLAAVGRGEAFLLQGGDCAEMFDQATADTIRNKIRTVLQMAVVLTYGASLPVVKMGRMAGQYAKPRSSDTEVRDGIELPVYRGDAVNSHEFTPEARTPDPGRLLAAYHRSSATLNLIRAFTTGGFADLRHVHAWNRGFLANPAYSRYEQLAAEIDRAIRFMAACGADFDALKSVEFFASHEALLLDYERPLTRIDSRTGVPYDCSAHFLWIGERTRQVDQAHVQLLAQVANPLGVKIGPNAQPEEVLALAEALNPERREGRLTFITRMGAGTVRDALPPLIKAMSDAGHPVVWVCDPMHGNTFAAPSGYKTRSFDVILDEVRGFFDVHRRLGSVPGGLHVELTGDDVTEILGGATHIDDAHLADRYETLVDPRLNHQQSLEMAFQVAEMLQGR